jgi:hypothetical protein
MKKIKGMKSLKKYFFTLVMVYTLFCCKSPILKYPNLENSTDFWMPQDTTFIVFMTKDKDTVSEKVKVIFGDSGLTP